MLTPTKKHVARSLVKNSKGALVAELFKDPVSRQYMMKKMAVVMRHELKSMCSERVNSILSSQCSSHLRQFTWDKLLQELLLNAPVFLSVLLSLTQTRQPRLNRAAIIGMCSALLLKLRFSKMSTVQKLISLILYAGHSGKQVQFGL